MSLVWIQIPHSTKFKIYIFFSNVLIEIRNHTNQNPFSLFLLLLLYFQNHLPSLFQNPKTLTLTQTHIEWVIDLWSRQYRRWQPSQRRRRGASSRIHRPTAFPTSVSPTTAIISSSPHGIRYCFSLSLSLSLSLTFRMVPIGQSVRLYDASANALRGEFMHGGPVLDCCFHDDSSGFSAGADNTVRRLVFFILFYFLFYKHFALIFCLVAEKVRETKKKIR